MPLIILSNAKQLKPMPKENKFEDSYSACPYVIPEGQSKNP